MEPTLNPKKAVQEYFRIWKTYSTLGVMQLFDANARYEIIPKQRTLNGSAEICKYWKRNSQRQKGLKLLWDIRSIKKTYAKVHFIAKFYDIDENEHQKVEGVIKFYLNEKSAVTLLSEYYQKLVEGGNNGYMPGIK